MKQSSPWGLGIRFTRINRYEGEKFPQNERILRGGDGFAQLLFFGDNRRLSYLYSVSWAWIFSPLIAERPYIALSDLFG
jgi:hypothetical protein